MLTQRVCRLVGRRPLRRRAPRRAAHAFAYHILGRLFQRRQQGTGKQRAAHGKFTLDLLGAAVDSPGVLGSLAASGSGDGFAQMAEREANIVLAQDALEQSLRAETLQRLEAVALLRHGGLQAG